MLIITMLASLLPSVAFAVEPYTLTYTFNRHSVESESTLDVTAGIEATVGPYWKLLNFASFYSTPQLAGQALKLVANRKSNQSYMLFKVKVDVSGTYTPSITYAPEQAPADRLGSFNVYFFGADALTEKGLSEASAMGDIAATISPLNSAAISMKDNTDSPTVSFNNVTLEGSSEANYFLMIEVNGVASKVDDQVHIKNFTLTKSTEPNPDPNPNPNPDPDPNPNPDPDPEPDPEPTPDPDDDGVSANMLKYNFNYTTAGAEDNISADVGVKSAEAEVAKWEVVRKPLGFSNYSFYASYLMLTRSDVNNGIIFKITVDKERMYMPSVTYRTRNRGALLEVYLIDEATVSTNGWDMKKVGYDEIYSKLSPLDNAQVDLYVNDADTSAVGEKHNFRGRRISRGTYYLIFRASGTNPAVTHAKPQLFIDNFTLETAENCLQYVEVSASKNVVGFGESAELSVSGIRLDSTVIPFEELTVNYVSSDPGVVSVDKDGRITGRGIGKAKITVTVSDEKNTVAKTIDITAEDNTAIKKTALSAPKTMYVTGSAKLIWKATLESGNVLLIPFDSVSASISEEGVVSVDSEGNITALAEGKVTVALSSNFRDAQIEDQAEIVVTVDGGKTEPTYYTYERRENAIKNAQKYDWAKAELKSAKAKADKYLENIEKIYDSIAGEGIPRSNHIGYLNDPAYTRCKWCGVDVTAEYGTGKMGGWLLNVVNDPWKIQCPGCKRRFPSNDFALLYERGLDENGLYNRELAIKNNAAAVEKGEKDALRNELYPELDASINLGAGLRDGETVEGWGVDDGFGYVPYDADGKMFEYINEVKECHAYIPYYMNYAWNYYKGAVGDLADAYLYSGDIKYGRAGVVLLDRIVDFYPTFNASMYKRKYHLSDGGSKLGHIQGRISESSTIANFALQIDALYPAISDSEVIEFLSRKASELGTADVNDKSTAEKIWENWENNMLLVMPTILKTGRAQGNVGLYQYAMACAAIVLDREPFTTEMIEWIYANDDINTDYKNYNTDTLDDSIVTVEGGDFGTLLINLLDRDGMSNESAAAYNGVPLSRFSKMADVLGYYTGEGNYNPYEHPKYVSMLTAFIPIVTANSQTINVGDNIGTAQLNIKGAQDAYITMFNMTDDENLKKRLAEFLFLGNGCKTDGLTNSIFDKDADGLAKEIESYIDGTPTLPSQMMTGYGFAVLRAGKDHVSVSQQTAVNTLRDFWMYFGGFAGHGHADTLNLGIEAYGLNIAPDLGYAEEAGTDPMRLQWIGQSLSHNVISIDQKSQATSEEAAFPVNFDDSGKVKVMEVSADNRYAKADKYRRTVVMVEVDDSISYGVDFYRVKGGNMHTFSFHSQAENAYGEEGLDFTPVWDENGNYVSGAQTVPEDGEYTVSYWNEKEEYVTEQVFKKAGEYIGSYADIRHEAGRDPNSPPSYSYETVYPRGYSWLGKVRRDETPESKFSVEFDVEDYRGAVANGDDIALRVTQLNDFTADEVALVSGPIPNKGENKDMPSTLDYLLVQRKGENLDSLFTTVYEPYRGERYVNNMTAIEPVVAQDSQVNPTADDVARAVLVEHENGRRDYIVYASNASVTYDVDGEFEFRGSVGVLSKNANGEVIYRYVCNGDIISEETGVPARLSGTVAGFSENLTRTNYIDVNIDAISADELTDRYIYIQNDGVENGVYRIESASDNAEGLEEGQMRLYTGDVTPIRAYRDNENLDAGYIYNITTGQEFTIPLSYVDDGAPRFAEVSDVSASAGNSMTIALYADSDLEDVSIEYFGETLPRGAIIDKDTGVLTWTPTSSQLGDNHFAVTAVDSDGRETTIHFTVTVYGSTIGSSGAAGSGGGGGSGSGATKPDENENTPADNEQSENVTSDDITPQKPSDGNSESAGFTDISDYDWAADAINSLAELGIIKGTTEETYSPSANITRADFAILLVRAFELESENTENFTDVDTNDYFVRELAIARNTGIVGGIGENKFAPRNTITRQDMMTIVYRALTALGKITVGDGAFVISDYPDFESVADYAKEAVMALITQGLINGKSGKVAPGDYTTRAEVAVLVKRVLDYIK